MLFAVRVPQTQGAFRGGYVISWHVAEGHEVGFGSPLCDIAVDEFLLIRREKRAINLGSTSRLRRRRVKDSFDLRKGRGEIRIRLISAERSLILSRVITQPGDRIQVGDVVAVLGTEKDRTSDLNSVPDARVSVDFVDVPEINPL